MSTKNKNIKTEILALFGLCVIVFVVFTGVFYAEAKSVMFIKSFESDPVPYIVPDRPGQFYLRFPHKEKPVPIKATATIEKLSDAIIREITMYNSLPDQTDGSPCIAAWGDNICEYRGNVCATNAYPKNTRLKIEKLGECIVLDRMASRFANRIDWYAGMDKVRAINFGKQNLKVEVIL